MEKKKKKMSHLPHRVRGVVCGVFESTRGKRCIHRIEGPSILHLITSGNIQGCGLKPPDLKASSDNTFPTHCQVDPQRISSVLDKKGDSVASNLDLCPIDLSNFDVMGRPVERVSKIHQRNPLAIVVPVAN